METTAEILFNQNLNVLAKMASKKENSPKKVLNSLENVPLNLDRKMKNIKSCTFCEQGNCDMSCDKENKSHAGFKTPNKIALSFEATTPMSNLKMLVCAASVLAPAGSQDGNKESFMARSKQEVAECGTKVVNENKMKSKRSGELMGRKEKSLGLLCKKFMLLYPEYSENGTTILLDNVVKGLNIGRRRVYDIVNVLESIEMMVRQAKNKYLWYGKSRLPRTLTKLKALALHAYGPNFSLVLDRFKHVIKKDEKNTEKQGDSSSNEMSATTSESENEEPIDDVTKSIMDNIISNDFSRREQSRSLGILCQKFLMLFMVAEDSVVTLDRAAKLLIVEPDEGPGKYKTKVRRLYDIANILTSINFLEKCVSYEDTAKKAAYRWIGIDLKALSSSEETKKAFESQEFTFTRHSLLSQIPRRPFQNQEEESGNNQLKFQCRSASAHQLTSPGNTIQSSGKLKFPRTFSATAVIKQEDDVFEDNDGFDVEQWSAESSQQSPPANTDNSSHDSPKESLFKEKLRKLQEEFPDKLSNDGIHELLSACKNNVSKQQGRASRRSLSSDFDAGADVSLPPMKKRKINRKETDNSNSSPAASESALTKSDMPVITKPVSYAALKPLLSYASTSSATCYSTQIKVTATSKAAEIQAKVTSQQPAYLTLPDTLKLKHINQTNGNQAPFLVSTVGAPITLANNGYYQIIPVQCQPMASKSDPTILKTIKVPFLVNNKQQVTSAQSIRNSSAVGQMVTIMRPQLINVNSPTVNGTTKNVLRKNDPQMISINQQMITEKYPEFVTPPHVQIRGGSHGKPQANPIIFPKMTPETPSTDSQLLLNAVTRKLMSLHGE